MPLALALASAEAPACALIAPEFEKLPASVVKLAPSPMARAAAEAVALAKALPVCATAVAVSVNKAKFAIRTNSRARDAYRVQTGEIGLSWSRHRVAIECSSELTRGMTVVDRLNAANDDNNRNVWAAHGPESAGADVLWTLDAAKFKSMLKAALAA